ncbi:MAG TPA: hypothetical protein VE028_12885 [Nitratidesulfovibrio sp.]|nr:hypothetical protein [Nitratidesulfovibrio sp.]
MKIAFHIGRANYFRSLGPLIDVALESHDVTLWVDGTTDPKSLKHNPPQSQDTIPAFSKPVASQFYCDRASLRDILEGSPETAIVGIAPLPYGLREHVPSSSCFCYLQCGMDFVPDIMRDDFENLNPDMILFYSSYWKETLSKILLDKAYGDYRATRLRLTPFQVCSGWGQMDQVVMFDRENILKKYNLPCDKNIVVLAAYPYNSNPKTAWDFCYKHDNKVARYAWGAINGRLASVRKHPSMTSDRDIAAALHDFCVNNNAFLVVKYREKDPVSKYFREIADLCIGDESHYPFNFMEVLSVARLSVSFCSTSVLESAACGCPHLCLDISEDPELRAMSPSLQVFCPKNNVGSVFNYPGVSYSLRVGEAVEVLPHASFEQFVLIPSQHARYCHEYLGTIGGNSSRILEAIRRYVESR